LDEPSSAGVASSIRASENLIGDYPATLDKSLFNERFNNITDFAQSLSYSVTSNTSSVVPFGFNSLYRNFYYYNLETVILDGRVKDGYTTTTSLHTITTAPGIYNIKLEIEKI
jgi:hypothetical protein